MEVKVMNSLGPTAKAPVIINVIQPGHKQQGNGEHDMLLQVTVCLFLIHQTKIICMIISQDQLITHTIIMAKYL
ncbi:MAG: hypothetical protein CM15mV1_0750 [uncultured marine virus]|nr:MAG: hypothetical protein CM15mV1_0750 [uncultured marine virus]